MIAIPNFVSGAMEHWGLITYREVNMLYDAMEASAANKQRVAVVVAHEIAHMVKFTVSIFFTCKTYDCAPRETLRTA